MTEHECTVTKVGKIIVGKWSRVVYKCETCSSHWYVDPITKKRIYLGRNEVLQLETEEVIYG